MFNLCKFFGDTLLEYQGRLAQLVRVLVPIGIGMVTELTLKLLGKGGLKLRVVKD